MKEESINQQTYSTPKALEVYTTSYLWPYERVMFDAYLKPGMKALDVGCGAGRLAPFWIEREVQVIGIDMVEQFIRQAKSLYPHLDFQVMNAAELKLPNAAFDFVFFSNQGIDYTERHQAVLAEAYRVLKPGGFFVYSAHNSLSLPRTRRAWRKFFRDWRAWRVGYHFRIEHHPNGDLHVAHNNIWSEQRLIKAAGFTVVEILSNNRRFPRWPKIFTGIFTRWPMYVCRKPEK